MTTEAPAKPIGEFMGLPLYKHGTAPAHLRTKTMLARIRLQPAPGQRPVCYVIPYYHPDEHRALYEPADAAPIVRSIGDEWAWRTRRTCPRCGEVREYVLNGRQCGDCSRRDRERAEERHKRRCADCKRLGTKPYPEVRVGWYTQRLCRFCIGKRNRALDGLLRAAIRCAGGCGKRVATKKQILAWCTSNHQAVSRFILRCPACQAVHAADVAREEAERRERWAREQAAERERNRAARLAREQEVAELAAWAAAALADPDVRILDTETTGLEDDARILDLAVITGAGQVLLDTLVNPGVPIPPEATAIHGITDEMVKDAPSFAHVLPELAEAVSGGRVLIYNDVFDLQRLGHELGVHHGESGDLLDVGRRWIAAHNATAEDAMIPYSDWVGEWSDYWGNNRWQPLNGGHRALGDCLAVIECLKAMARSACEAEDEEIAA